MCTQAQTLTFGHARSHPLTLSQNLAGSLSHKASTHSHNSCVKARQDCQQMLCSIYRDEVPVRDGQRKSKRKKRKIKDNKNAVIRKQNSTDEDSNNSSTGKYNND